MPRDLNRYQNNVLREGIIERIKLRREKHHDFATTMAMETVSQTPINKKGNVIQLHKTKLAIHMYRTEVGICNELIDVINGLWPKEA